MSSNIMNKEFESVINVIPQIDDVVREEVTVNTMASRLKGKVSMDEIRSFVSERLSSMNNVVSDYSFGYRF